MNQDIVSFSRFIDCFKYSDNILEIVDEYLKRIFDADMIFFHEAYINKGYRGLYLPVSVEGKNVGYCEVVGLKKKLSDEEINVIVSLLMQLFTKLNFYVETSIKKHHNLVYAKDYLRVYQNNLDLDSVLVLSCLFINIYDYEAIVSKYGVEAANDMMKIAINMIKSVFNLPNDTIFKYNENQIVVFITNRTNLSIQPRVSQLKGMLNSNDINVTFGLSSSVNFDLGNLIFLAEQNMCYSENAYRRYY